MKVVEEVLTIIMEVTPQSSRSVNRSRMRMTMMMNAASTSDLLDLRHFSAGRNSGRVRHGSSSSSSSGQVLVIKRESN